MKIGLVLSGGGIRGIAHLGVLKAFSNLGITFSHISGTSAGAIAGAFFAAGIDPGFAVNAGTTYTRLTPFQAFAKCPSTGNRGTICKASKTNNPRTRPQGWVNGHEHRRN